MADAEYTYKKYRSADDEPGDAAWAARLNKRAVWLPDEESTNSKLELIELAPDEQVLVRLLRLPRRYADVEGCGALPLVDTRRFLRALHAAEVLETQDLDKARALVPIEVKRAREAIKGAPAGATPAAKPRAKLRGQVYRPPIDGAQPAAAIGSAGSALSSSLASAPEKKPVSDEERTIERDVGEAFKALKNADHFKVMGVERNATSEEVKKAYFELAKRFHPDRVAGHNFSNPEQTAERFEQVFARVSEAYRVLQDPDQRAAYVAELDSGAIGGDTGGRQRRPQEATLQYKKGMVFLHKKELDQAIKMFQMATDLDPLDPLYATFLAWARYLDERKPKAEREQQAREALEALLKKTPHAETAYYLGMVLKLAGNEKTALRHFKQATELNPNHNEALREVRLADLRAERSRQTDGPMKRDGGSLLDRFLKK